MASEINASIDPGNTLGDQRPVIFFDGECRFCNRFVDLLIGLDPSEIFHLAPLQGLTAQQLLPPLPPQREAWSIYYLEGDRLTSESDAFLAICRRLGGPWKVVSWGVMIPRWLRDGLYRQIARHRYRFLGRRSTCRTPSDRERLRFLP